MEAAITSASNQYVKRIRKLVTSAKARRNEGVYVAESVHVVQSYLQAGGVPELLVVAQSALENDEVTELIWQCTAENIVVADSLFESFSDLHAGVGVLMLFRPTQTNIEVIVPLSKTTLVLENVQDPGNLGTILRTASAVGVTQIVLSVGCASPWSPKVLRAGMGAQFLLDIYEDNDVLQTVKNAKVPVLVTTLSDDSTSLYELKLDEPVIWVFGNEGQGVSQELTEIATTRITIPQAENSVESLNVSASVAVCLYEQYRQMIHGKR